MKIMLFDCGHRLGIGWTWAGKRHAVGIKMKTIFYGMVIGITILVLSF